MRNMNVVHISYAYSPDQLDPEVWLNKLSFFTGILDSMAQKFSVHSIHCIRCNAIVKRNNVVYHFLDLAHWQTTIPFSANRYIGNLKPDIVVVHGLIFPLQILLLRQHLGPDVKIIVQHHAERPLRKLRRFFQQRADRFISAYIFCSRELGKDWLDSHLISESKKIREIMEVSSVFSPMNKDKAKSLTNVEGEMVYLWVGGLHARKDPLLAVTAFANLIRQSSSAKLYMIFHSIELLDEVRHLIVELRVADHIFLVGSVEHGEMLYWYNSADFIISTSNYEGSGVAVCEAISCGCIPILSDIPSFKMMTGNGSVGILYLTGNQTSLSQALSGSMKLNRSLEREKVLVQFQRELSFEAIARKFSEVIEDISR